MALQQSVAVRNARLDAIEVAIGASPLLQLRTGAPAASCAAAAAGSLVASGALPVDWLAAAASGAKTKSGTWSLTASATGAIGHFRILDSTGTTCHMQGTVSAAGGGGDAIADALDAVLNQVINVTAFQITAGNA